MDLELSAHPEMESRCLAVGPVTEARNTSNIVSQIQLQLPSARGRKLTEDLPGDR